MKLESLTALLVALLVASAPAGAEAGERGPADSADDGLAETAEDASQDEGSRGDGNNGDANNGDANNGDGNDGDGNDGDGNDGDGDGRREEARAGGSDPAAAQSLEQLGRDLLKRGRIAEACATLDQSLDAAPRGEVALLLADCHLRLGKVASAWAELRQAAGMLGDEGYAAAARKAAARAAELEPRIPKLTIVPSVEIAGMQVWRDGVRFGPGIFGVAVAIDPGKHVVEVRAPGYQTFRTVVKLSERGDRKGGGHSRAQEAPAQSP